MPVSVGVIFELRQARTRPGEAIHIVGTRRELGKWQPLPQEDDQARSLSTSPVLYPRWYLHAPIWFQLETETELAAGAKIDLEYKFVRDRRGLDDGLQHVKWEVSIPNRRVSLPVEDGSIWIVSDGSWNSSRDVPKVTRATPGELTARLSSLGVGTVRPGAPQLALPEGPLGIVPKLYLPEITGEEEEDGCMARRGSQHFRLTPRQNAGLVDSGGNVSPWPIEAEFSANFSTPPMSPDMDMRSYQDSFLMDTESDSCSGNDDDESCKDSVGLFEAQTTEDRHEIFGPHPGVEDYFLDSEDEQDNEAACLRAEIDCLREAAEEAAAKADAQVSHLKGELERLRGVATESATEAAEKDDEAARLREEIDCLRDGAEEAAAKADAQVSHLKGELERLRGVATESAAEAAAKDNEAARLRDEIDCLRDAAEVGAAKADAQVSHLKGELERLRGVATESATEAAEKDDEILELRLENERLQAIVEEASEEVQALMMQNKVLRESLERARNGASEAEIQSPKKPNGSRNWARTRSLRWIPNKEVEERTNALMAMVEESEPQEEPSEPQEEP